VTSGTCPPPVPPNLPGQETMDERAVRLERVGLFVRAHHAKMLARQRTYPKFSYYFMVHHQPSNPYLFEKFNALDLDDVRAYDLVVESACYQIANGHVIKKLVGRTIERFDVR
jgi:cytidylate kinase